MIVLDGTNPGPWANRSPLHPRTGDASNGGKLNTGELTSGIPLESHLEDVADDLDARVRLRHLCPLQAHLPRGQVALHGDDEHEVGDPGHCRDAHQVGEQVDRHREEDRADPDAVYGQRRIREALGVVRHERYDLETRVEHGDSTGTARGAMAGRRVRSMPKIVPREQRSGGGRQNEHEP